MLSAVEFGEDDDLSRTACFFGFAPSAARVDFDAGVGVDRDQCRFHGAERADHLTYQVGVARRVDQVEEFAGVFELTTDASMECLWCFSSSSKSQMLVPESTLGLAADRAALHQQLIDQSRLARAAVSANGDVPEYLPRFWSSQLLKKSHTHCESLSRGTDGRGLHTRCKSPQSPRPTPTSLRKLPAQ